MIAGWNSTRARQFYKEGVRVIKQVGEYVDGDVQKGGKDGGSEVQ